MTPPVWQLAEHTARLRLAQLAAAIDLSRPADGLVDFQVGADSLGGACLLGIEIPPLPAGNPQALAECYVRGADLVAVYEESKT